MITDETTKQAVYQHTFENYPETMSAGHSRISRRYICSPVVGRGFESAFPAERN